MIISYHCTLLYCDLPNVHCVSNFDNLHFDINEFVYFTPGLSRAETSQQEYQSAVYKI